MRKEGVKARGGLKAVGFLNEIGGSSAFKQSGVTSRRKRELGQAIRQKT